MILKNSVRLKKIILGFKLLLLLVILLYSVRYLYVRFIGDKVNVVVESIHRYGFRSSYSTAKVVFEGREREVFFCKNNIEVGTKIEVYNSKLLNLMIYSRMPNGIIIFYIIVVLITTIAICSLFIKDDES